MNDSSKDDFYLAKILSFHGFKRNQNILSQLMKNENFYVSLGEGVFYENLRDSVIACPLERLFLEKLRIKIGN